MGRLSKWFGFLGAWIILAEQVGFAQSQSLVHNFGNVLIGVSALLASVSFVFVMLKAARLIDLFINRMEHQDQQEE